MQASCSIVIGRIRELARDYPVATRLETEAVLGVITARLEAEVARRTPTGVGGQAGLRGSIHGEVVSLSGTSVAGVVGTPLEYGEVVELGRRPGKFPPLAPIELWVRRKLGVPDAEARGVAFLVARKIARVGFDGAHMFENSWKSLEHWAMRELQTIPGRVIDRVIRGRG